MDTTDIDAGWTDGHAALIAEMAQALYDAMGCRGVEPMVRLLAYAEGRVPLADGTLPLDDADLEVLSEELSEADWVEIPRPALPVALRDDELVDVTPEQRAQVRRRPAAVRHQRGAKINRRVATSCLDIWSGLDHIDRHEDDSNRRGEGGGDGENPGLVCGAEQGSSEEDRRTCGGQHDAGQSVLQGRSWRLLSALEARRRPGRNRQGGARGGRDRCVERPRQQAVARDGAHPPGEDPGDRYGRIDMGVD